MPRNKGGKGGRGGAIGDASLVRQVRAFASASLAPASASLRQSAKAREAWASVKVCNCHVYRHALVIVVTILTIAKASLLSLLVENFHIVLIWFPPSVASVIMPYTLVFIHM